MTFAPPSFDLTGRVAIVTGGNSGIGRSIALGLASAGAAVAILARNAERSAAVVEEIRALGRPAIAVALDVSRREALAPAIDAAEAALGAVDILVNNAGNIDISGGILHQTEEGWDGVMATHLTATFLLSQRAAQSMRARKGGKIINIGSMSSLFGSAAVPAYGAAKAAIVQLTKSMAIELAPDNIQVNAIAPGWIETDMTGPIRDQAEMDDYRRVILARTPAGRWGRADECAGAAVFLASPAAGFVTGTLLPVDGGYSVF
jgi:2-dehydro-3-deoxy-D-gluconate 5-dehydrogenase